MRVSPSALLLVVATVICGAVLLFVPQIGGTRIGGVAAIGFMMLIVYFIDVFFFTKHIRYLDQDVGCECDDDSEEV